MSRECEWLDFSTIVREHVVYYTIPQYGDKPKDMISTWSVDDCLMAISRYVTRSKVSKRGELESLRDLVKIAHYACITFSKKCELYEKQGIKTEELIKLIGEGSC